jgi:hypothetical protein
MKQVLIIPLVLAFVFSSFSAPAAEKPRTIAVIT